ncbi:hypothetical protein ACFSQZ_03220 [Rubritalea spongiae]|uniref:Uncharacterized protein n=1 Tax=Rubritalea spongiae TaxID=430797 RepID=A0ABW5E3L7_9BACT
MDDTARETLQYLREKLGDLSEVNARIAVAEENLFRDYIRGYAVNKHATARRLGAQPTGFYERAAESAEGTSTAFGVTVSVAPREAFARAFKQVEITPRAGKKWLTIPAVAAAYGRRAGEVTDLQFVPLGAETAALMRRDKASGVDTVFYWLKKKVVQEQQRELLPSDAAVGEVAGEAAEDVFIELIAEGGVV